jgi:hypothetical protein
MMRKVAEYAVAPQVRRGGGHGQGEGVVEAARGLRACGATTRQLGSAINRSFIRHTHPRPLPTSTPRAPLRPPSSSEPDPCPLRFPPQGQAAHVLAMRGCRPSDEGDIASCRAALGHDDAALLALFDDIATYASVRVAGWGWGNRVWGS